MHPAHNRNDGSDRQGRPRQARTRPGRTREGVFVIFSQTYVPDPAAVGQHMHLLAAEMARRGHHVIAYASSRGYEDPSQRYPRHEWRDGVEIRRIPFASFGKASIPRRIAGTVSFLGQTLLRGLLTREVRGILFSTSPPMTGAMASVVKQFTGAPSAYWAMDLNPDQLIAMGKLRPEQLACRTLERMNRFLLNDADYVIALDRFMARRLRQRADLGDRLDVVPPGSLEDQLDPVPHEANPFRQQHGLQGKRVIMYSGNHSPANPLETLLQAMLRYRNDERLVFAFIGGGLGKKQVEAFVREHDIRNTLLLPYQPLDQIRYSLSAADVHVVSLGANMVGIVHPCKIYGAMQLSRPVLYLGPSPSHVADLLAEDDFGWAVEHGQVDACARAIAEVRDLPEPTLQARGKLAGDVFARKLSHSVLNTRICDRLEAMMNK